MRKRKQNRPQHLTEAKDDSEAKFVVVNDRKTDIQTTPSVVNAGTLENQFRLKEGDNRTEDRNFLHKMSDSEDIEPENKEHNKERSRQSLSPLRSDDDCLILTRDNDDDLLENHFDSYSYSEKRNTENIRRNVLFPCERKNGSRPHPALCGDQQDSSTGSLNETGSCVIGKESHVTKLQSFVDSLTDLKKPSRCFESTMSLPLHPRLKHAYGNMTVPNGSHFVQTNSAYKTCRHPKTTSYDMKSCFSTEEPLDLSTKKCFSKSAINDPKYTNVNPLETRRSKREGFEYYRHSTAENLDILPLLLSAIQERNSHFESAEFKSVASSARTNDSRQGGRVDLERHKKRLSSEKLRIEISSQSAKSQCVVTSEDDCQKRKQRNFPMHGFDQCQEKLARKRKLTDLRSEKRNSDHVRSYQNTNYPIPCGKRLKSSDLGLTESLQTSDKTKRDGEDMLRTKCNCGIFFESLYQLAVHIQKSGHVPVNLKPDSTDRKPKPVYGQDAWISEEQETTLKRIQNMTSFSSPTRLNDDAITKHECGFRDSLETNENQKELDERNLLDRNSLLLSDFRSRMTSEFGEESVCNETHTNSKIQDELSKKEISSESDLEENFSISDRLPHDNDKEEYKTPAKVIHSTRAITEHLENRRFSFSQQNESKLEIVPSVPPESVSQYSSLRDTSSTAASPAVESSTISVTVNDYLKSVSDDKSGAMKKSEKHVIQSRDQTSGDDRSSPNTCDKTRLPKRRCLSGNLQTIEEKSGRKSSENLVDAAKAISDETQTALEFASKRKIDRKKLNRKNREKKQSSPDLLLCRGNFLDGMSQPAAGDMKCSDKSEKEFSRSFEPDLLFVSPSSDHVDGSFSLLAMKNFVDNHFSNQGQSKSAGSRLPSRNHRTTNDTGTVLTSEVEARCSPSTSERSPTIRRPKDPEALKNPSVLSRRQSRCHEAIDRISDPSSNETAKRQDSEDTSKDIQGQKQIPPQGRELEFIIAEKQREDSESFRSRIPDSDLSFRSCRFRLQNQCSDESSVAGDPKNGVAVVQSESMIEMASSSFSDDTEAEKCGDSVSVQLKKCPAHEFTGDFDQTRFSPPSEKTLVSSVSSTYPGVHFSDAMHETDRNFATNSVNRFRCNESLEQVC